MPSDNAVATPWEDSLSLIESLYITIYKGQQEDREGLISSMKQLQDEDYNKGGVLRWIIQAAGPKGLAVDASGTAGFHSQNKG